jgi:hypothetical protein
VLFYVDSSGEASVKKLSSLVVKDVIFLGAALKQAPPSLHMGCEKVIE